MNVTRLIQKDKSLIEAFKRYQKRYLNKGKKPDMTKLLPELLYSDMRLEGEKITKKQARDFFK